MLARVIAAGDVRQGRVQMTLGRLEFLVALGAGVVEREGEAERGVWVRSKVLRSGWAR